MFLTMHGRDSANQYKEREILTFSFTFGYQRFRLFVVATG